MKKWNISGYESLPEPQQEFSVFVSFGLHDDGLDWKDLKYVFREFGCTHANVNSNGDLGVVKFGTLKQAKLAQQKMDGYEWKKGFYFETQVSIEHAGVAGKEVVCD
jgi:hypothetical protein